MKKILGKTVSNTSAQLRTRDTANKSLSSALAQARNGVAQANTAGEVIQALHPLTLRGEELRFDFIALYLSLAGGAILIGLAFFVARQASAFTTFSWVTLLAGLIVAAVSVGRMSGRSKLIPDLTSLALNRFCLLSNGLHRPSETYDTIFSKLSADFKDYNRGNYSHALRDVLDGELTVESEQRPFRYIHLHYVNEREEEYYETDRDGKRVRKTRIVYDHYDRYSLVIPGCSTRDVSAASDRSHPITWKTKWETSLKDFNRRVAISGASEMNCARFARPATILHIQRMDAEFSALNIEFSNNGAMCVSFNNANLLDFTRPTTTLRFPSRFLGAIEQGIGLPILDRALLLAGELAQKNTDSFRETADHPITNTEGNV